MQDVEVIEDAEAAAAALDPVRARLLAELAVPASAAGLAARVGITRQKVNYHLRTLEAHGLVQRRVLPEMPVRVEYALTPKGEGLRQVLLLLHNWAEAWESDDEPQCDEC